jgi:hypothetical protein
LKELEEDIETSSEFQGTIANLPIGLHIIPPGDENIIVNVPRVFTVKIVSFVELNETFPITVKSSDPLISVRSSPVFLRRFSEDKKVATTTFVLESDIEGAKAKIEVNYNEFNNDLSVSVINPPKPIELPLGLSFDKPTYHLKVNKEKTLYLWLNVGEHTANEYQAETISGRREIIVKGGGKCSLKKTSDPGIFSGKFQVLGHRSKVKGVISANVPGFQPAHTNLIVEEKELGSHIKLQFHPDEDDFGPVRYCWDDENPYVLKIAARHPSIRQYLGTPLNDNYPGIDSQLYHGMLAEVVAEALAFRILESQFKTEGQLGMVDYTFVDANFHKHYSDFLTVCHESLNPIVDSLARQSKIL